MITILLLIILLLTLIALLPPAPADWFALLLDTKPHPFTARDQPTSRNTRARSWRSFPAAPR